MTDFLTGYKESAALIDALRHDQIAGTRLDVFETEPLPPESPLWQMDGERVIISPHISGFTPHYDERASALFAENLRRYLAGEPLLNLVERERLLIKGIIFDLGSTLIRFSGDWPTVICAGAEAMADWYLKKRHIKLDGITLAETFLAERINARAMAEETQVEVLAQHSLRQALKKIQAPATAEALVEAAIKVYFAPEEAAYQVYPDAIATLKQLKDQGYCLGLYSNATDDKLIQRLVNQYHLRPWLSPTFSSACWGWRKPKPEAFALIARRWGLSPAEIVVVGDTLNADILGAHQAGMFSILVTMDEATSNTVNQHIQPTAVAEQLSALPELMAKLG